MVCLKFLSQKKRLYEATSIKKHFSIKLKILKCFLIPLPTEIKNFCNFNSYEYEVKGSSLLFFCIRKNMKSSKQIENRWNKLADKKTVEKTIGALKKSGIDACFVKTASESKKKILEIIPEGSEVMTMSSVTLDASGISSEINDSKRFNAIRDRLYSMDRNKQKIEMNRLGASHEYVIGSVHAVTEDGKVLIASNSGSQLPAYAYGAGKVIWIVGTQKIVKNIDGALKRIYEYTFPLEDARAKKAYGMNSNVSKILIVNKEIQPGRIILIFVDEVLGF